MIYEVRWFPCYTKAVHLFLRRIGYPEGRIYQALHNRGNYYRLKPDKLLFHGRRWISLPHPPGLAADEGTSIFSAAPHGVPSLGFYAIIAPRWYNTVLRGYRGGCLILILFILHVKFIERIPFGGCSGQFRGNLMNYILRDQRWQR